MNGGWDGEAVTYLCNIDWACLWSNLSSPAIWGPAIYSLVATVAAATPTEGDTGIANRLKHLMDKGIEIAKIIGGTREPTK